MIVNKIFAIYSQNLLSLIKLLKANHNKTFQTGTIKIRQMFSLFSFYVGKFMVSSTHSQTRIKILKHIFARGEPNAEPCLEKENVYSGHLHLQICYLEPTLPLHFRGRNKKMK